MAVKGHKVTLIVADSLGKSCQDGVHILDAGAAHSRLHRMMRSTANVKALAMSLSADIYVLHDPELIPAGIHLKKMGRKVVFDSHEDVPTQLRGKPYLGRISAECISRSYQTYERHACRQFDGVVGATPFIRDKFQKINHGTIDINNYPILNEFNEVRPWSDKLMQVCYVGNIAAMRGIRELVQSCSHLHTPTTLALAGVFETPALASELASDPGWRRVRAHGHLDRSGVSALMARSVAGLVTLHPQANYLESLPVKMFEYMAAGIPVIASNFPFWRTIIEAEACGICVDPLRPAEIAAAVDYIVAHPGMARQMGANGRRAVTEKFNWGNESQKMMDFYEAL